MPRSSGGRTAFRYSSPLRGAVRPPGLVQLRQDLLVEADLLIEETFADLGPVRDLAGVLVVDLRHGHIKYRLCFASEVLGDLYGQRSRSGRGRRTGSGLVG